MLRNKWAHVVGMSGRILRNTHNAAERALLILRDGNYEAPYGPLAAYLESLEKPFDPVTEAKNFVAQIECIQKELSEH